MRAFLSLAMLLATPLFCQSQDQRPAIGKEPVYQTKTPHYGILRFGLTKTEQVWLVRDGDALYVDSNGSGDLTEPGKKVLAERSPGRDPAEEGYSFDVGDVTVGGKTHKALAVYFQPLKRYVGTSNGSRSDVKAALAKDANGMAVSMRVEVERRGLTGEGAGGRVGFLVGPVDLKGVLQFANDTVTAPVVNFENLLEINFYAALPILRAGRGSEMDLVVGIPGEGPGTFAMLEYEKTIPKELNPIVELSIPSAVPGDKPVKAKYEIKGRC